MTLFGPGSPLLLLPSSPSSPLPAASPWLKLFSSSSTSSSPLLSSPFSPLLVASPGLRLFSSSSLSSSPSSSLPVPNGSSPAASSSSSSSSWATTFLFLFLTVSIPQTWCDLVTLGLTGFLVELSLSAPCCLAVKNLTWLGPITSVCTFHYFLPSTSFLQSACLLYNFHLRQIPLCFLLSQLF